MFGNNTCLGFNAVARVDSAQRPNLALAFDGNIRRKVEMERKAPEFWRMPTCFGMATGPRRGPDGRVFNNINSPKSVSHTIQYRTDPDQLQALCPPRFELGHAPVVTVTATYMTEIEWLAGRGYATLGASFPVIFRGEVDYVEGSFLTVLWENLTDPILTGREELGFAKIYCELPPPRVLGRDTFCTASWLSYTFLDMSLTNMKEVDPASVTPTAVRNDGTLHYKYMPRTGEWGQPDAEYAVLTPAATPHRKVTGMWRGEGELNFFPARWDDMPTQYQIVNGLSGLEIREFLGSSIVATVGAKDLSDQRILR